VGGWGVTEGGWGVTVGDWSVITGVVVTVVDITVWETCVMSGTMVVTVERWFITVVRVGGVGLLNRVGRSNHPHHPGKTWT